ncbi:MULTISPECIES: dTDP-4-dehydrorhamnose 3,5-epimerase [unclassified Herbaspirillum]|uniref:dTDP-4-dehydrorhamnose 3,5-epimerase n=1 Tax=unclassified Herbaspirillum TaxID=2624150 RepID=UPI001154C484|nr:MULTISPECIES: dTDP-4-dehydrorhamnose 3,5-epimerase [unclassified Herbaspirillum]MBB5390104.1 dTDP-4-dehydrorhamnose 3,5-epimerase [Herbaspirillum sp. SJZ102]TQK09397.1 dTDP-4-dehydrorhamnose 3,5-epimerase [Herbaspirillum sp. SJZ130]TQK13916.1 dTDP-4-dehydrorhamnose 3,5-epimerase [Herbaspirillum sp. SJZ106]
MQVKLPPLSGVLLIEPRVFGDSRGFFYESFNARRFLEETGIDAPFVQDNHSKSARNVLRGLHYQIRHAQGKLVRVIRGAVLDVILDIRRNSPTFGQWFSTVLSEENKLQLWIPPGFAHGFSVLEDDTEFLYKTTDYWMPEHERCILWNDPAIGIDWQLRDAPIMSDKDKLGVLLNAAEVFE